MTALGKRYIMSVDTKTHLPQSEPNGTMCWVEDEGIYYSFLVFGWIPITQQVPANQATIDIYDTAALRTAAEPASEGQIGYAKDDNTTMVSDGTNWIAIAP